MVYSDGRSGIMRACIRVGLNTGLSTPDVSATITVAERSGQEVRYGMCELLLRAGLPAAFWPYAAICYAMMCNTGDMVPHQDDYLGMTKWHAQTSAPCKGHATHVGGAVSYFPTKYRHGIGKAAPRARHGVFMG